MRKAPTADRATLASARAVVCQADALCRNITHIYAWCPQALQLDMVTTPGLCEILMGFCKYGQDQTWMADANGKLALPLTYRQVTASEVARLAGVSQSAVSRSFTFGASISDKTKAKVLLAAEQLGYRPNFIARSLITRRSHIVGVAMAYLENQFYPAALEALSRRLQEVGLRVLLFTADHAKHPDPMLDEVLSYQVDALVLASTSLSSALAEDCRRAGVPVVAINRRPQNDSVSSVTGDNAKGGKEIAEFLLAGGHRRICYLAGLENSSTNLEREAAFRSVLDARGVELVARAVGNYTRVGAVAATRTLLRAEPDAIFCANDHMALAAIETVREAGLRVPQDISIVGFDDIATAAWPSFSLTTYSQPLQPMINQVIAIVTEMLGHADTPCRHIVVPGRLIVRSSARLPKI